MFDDCGASADDGKLDKSFHGRFSAPSQLTIAELLTVRALLPCHRDVDHAQRGISITITEVSFFGRESTLHFNSIASYKEKKV